MTVASDGPRPLLWPWALGYAVLALPFLPLWPDFETARRGLGSALGGVAFLALAWLRRGSRLPASLSACWLGVLALHGLSCLAAANPGDAIARGVWLASLWGIALLAARTSDATTQLSAVTFTGIAVAGFGLAQALGMPWPLGYSVADDPVSTLGNRNVAAEFVTLAVVAASILMLRLPRARVPLVAIVLGVAYLWVNQSRSGLLATGLTAIPLVFAPLRQHPLARRALLLGLALLGLGAGHFVPRAQVAPAMADSGGSRDPESRDGTAGPLSTVEVRIEIWRAGMRMLRESPWLGVGAAQFKVHYPRFRSQREIELSTRGREFAAAPLTAHDDPLEIGIETGLLGAGLYVAFWIAVARRRGRSGALWLLPLVAFTILSLVRSPLGNAPAAAFAFASVGALCAVRQQAAVRPPPWLRAGALVIAAAALWIGSRECAAQCAATAHVREVRKLPQERQNLVQMHALDRAVFFCPWDTQLRAMRSALRFELAAARKDLATVRALVAPGGDYDILLRHTPFHTTNLLRAAQAYQASGDRAGTQGLLAHILALDPPNPEARLFLATEQTLAGDAAAAVATLYADGQPHARLRAGLATHLRDLAQLATEAAHSALLTREALFVTAVDALRTEPTAAATGKAVRDFVDLASQADLRPFVLLAAASLHQGDHGRETAVIAAERAPSTASLTLAHARLLCHILVPLRALPSWDRRLRESR